MIPSLTEDDITAVTAVLRSGMLVQGKEVAALETEVSNIVNTKYAAALSNGTATLHLALVSLGIKPGDEVIVPAFSYVATANAVELVGALPVFVDIDPATFNIDVSKIENAITSNTKAIIPVHEFGLACDISGIMQIADKHGLHVIEDAACALGAAEDNKPVGSFGTFGSFSFHPRKSVTSGEGGILTTNDQALVERIQTLRNHGIKPGVSSMDFIEAGFNYRMTDFQAALVNSQLTRLEEIIKAKQLLADIYLNILNTENLSLPSVPAGKNHTWQTFHTVLHKRHDRNKVTEQLKQKGIGANYGAQCIPAVTFYQNKYAHNCAEKFPHALHAFNNGLALPLYPQLTEENITYIAHELNKILEND